jgi:biotin transporter BioY
MLANLFLIFLPGLIQLTLWLKLVEGSSPTLGRILTMGLTPFLAGGLIKAGLAAGITKVITPKKSFN